MAIIEVSDELFDSYSVGGGSGVVAQLRLAFFVDLAWSPWQPLEISSDERVGFDLLKPDLDAAVHGMAGIPRPAC